MKTTILFTYLFLSSFTYTQELPDFEIYNTKGAKVTKDTFLKSSKITVLNFWASWCLPCQEEMREISRIKSQDEFKNVQFISVTIDAQNGVENAKKIFKNNKYPWKLYIDTKMDLFNKVLAVTENTGTAIPISIVINEKGIIMAYHIGFDIETYKEDLINDIKLIEGK
jgi:cytochrome c biogenesis protein CcmG/thiol:disulfide interchange protein DsbE